jgi:hypothetical protein
MCEFYIFRSESVNLSFDIMGAAVRGSLWKRVSFDWWMLAEWSVIDEQPILLTYTNACITRAGGTQGVKNGFLLMAY